MNGFDIDTPEGMEAAKAWLVNHLEMIREGGVWAIPRALAIYQIFKSRKAVKRIMGYDRSTERVLVALGWQVEL